MSNLLWMTLFRDLENAAIYAKRRDYFIFRALNKYVMTVKALGVALIRYSNNEQLTPKLIYSGQNEVQVVKWLQRKVFSSTDITKEHLKQLPPNFPTSTNTLFISQHNGLFVLWHNENLHLNNEYHKHFLNYINALTYVEKKEELYFYSKEKLFERELSESIKHKQRDGLIELLSVAKTVSQSDFVFWGDVNSQFVEVSTNLGSISNGFGFELPIEQGIGGHVVQNNSLLEVNDYKNCEFRYPEVSTVVDRENVRTALAFPIKDQESNPSGILYVINREVKEFPLETRLLLLRLGHGVEPLTKQKYLKQFYLLESYSKFLNHKKTEFRKIIEEVQELEPLELWLEKFVKGNVFIVDENNHSLSNRNVEKLNLNSKEKLYSYKLTFKNGLEGKLFIRTDMKLPPDNWDDFIDYVISGIYIILERESRYGNAIEHKRSQWLNNMMSSNPNLELEYKTAMQLRVPVDQGEVWAVSWKLNERQFTEREKRQIEKVVLKETKNPIYFWGKTGFIFFDKMYNCEPEILRNELLKILPAPTWIINGSTYSSFNDLQNILLQLQLLTNKLMVTEHNKYIIEYNDFGLDYLLSDRSVSEKLIKFANKVLQPIINYDNENKTDITKTYTMSLVYKSPTKVAKKLFVHKNTVHYRVNRAKELLNNNMTNVGNDIALKLAAYTWLYTNGLI